MSDSEGQTSPLEPKNDLMANRLRVNLLDFV